MVQIPLGGQRTIKFSTDVENQYFDRVSDPGDLSIGLLRFDGSRREDPIPPGPLPMEVDELFNLVKSSPNRGTIRLGLKPTKDVEVGDAVRISAKLTGPEGDFQENILVKITDREKAKKPAPKGTKRATRNSDFRRSFEFTGIRERATERGRTWRAGASPWIMIRLCIRSSMMTC